LIKLLKVWFKVGLKVVDLKPVRILKILRLVSLRPTLPWNMLVPDREALSARVVTLRLKGQSNTLSELLHILFLPSSFSFCISIGILFLYGLCFVCFACLVIFGLKTACPRPRKPSRGDLAILRDDDFKEERRSNKTSSDYQRTRRSSR
jgi:hypothetical protein